jgi:Ca-activated chloride channel family protein
VTFTALSSAWLFALLVPLIIFYFLKLKRPRQIVPSLVLWRQVLSDQRVNSPFQRFKRNLLLLLQILLLVLLVLAAMQPFLRRDAHRTARLPVLVDVSASMGALDKSGGRSRLDEAKQRLRERIEGLPADQELCLVAFSRAARKLTGFTNNKTELRDALAALEVEDVPGDLDEALRLAQALARTTPFDRVLVLTDGNLPAKSGFELPFQIELQKLPPAGPNAGITAFNARRGSSGDWELFVQLGITDPAPAATATVELRAGDRVIAQEQVALTPGGTPRLAFRIAGAQGTSVRAVLRPGGFDSLASDNESWLHLPAVRALDVFVPESLAPFRHALAALDGLRIFPAKDAPSPGAFDLAISDKPGPPPALLLCTAGFVPEDCAALVSLAQKTTAAIDWRRDSPLLQHVSLDDVIFMEDPVTAEGKDDTAFANLGYEILAHGQHGPLALLRSEGGNARVHFLFQPERSTLPFRVAFPILVANLVQHAQSLAGLSEAAAVTTGVLPVQNFTAGASVTVRGPPASSRTAHADERGTVAGIPAARIGEYTFTVGGTTRTIGASLLSTSETGLATVSEVEFGDRISVATATATPRADHSLWWPLALAGFLVLLVEWWWFQRRTVA